MKFLFTLLASLFAVSVQAQTVFEQFTADDEWPAMNIIYPGEFFCTGGGEPVLDPSQPFTCEGGKGIHIRGTEMTSELQNSQPYDWRVEGIAWFELNANWDSNYTGPVMGSWRVYPYTHLDDPETYWEGMYTGKRELVDGTFPPLWITELKFTGIGFGDLEGQKMKATEVIKTYASPVPVPYELLPEELRLLLGIGTGPEGMLDITVMSQYD